MEVGPYSFAQVLRMVQAAWTMQSHLQATVMNAAGGITEHKGAKPRAAAPHEFNPFHIPEPPKPVDVDTARQMLKAMGLKHGRKSRSD